MLAIRAMIGVVVLVSVASFSAVLTPLDAQAALAVRNISQDTVVDPAVISARMNAVVAELDLYTRGDPPDTLRPLIDSTRALALRTPTVRSRAVREEMARRVLAQLATIRASLPAAMTSGARAVRARATGAPSPGVFILVPDVVFTFGYSYSAINSGHANTAEIETNLIGAAAGVVFDALGEERLGKYLKDNLGVGTGFPLDTGARLTGSAGIALGQTVVGRVRLLPALTVEELDAHDMRVPEELRTALPNEKSFSLPALSVTVVPGTAFVGRLLPLITVGYVAPQYFPGGPFNAVAALFSSKRSDYRRVGSSGWTLGIAVPLTGVKRATVDPQP